MIRPTAISTTEPLSGAASCKSRFRPGVTARHSRSGCEKKSIGRSAPSTNTGLHNSASLASACLRNRFHRRAARLCCIGWQANYRLRSFCGAATQGKNEFPAARLYAFFTLESELNQEVGSKFEDKYVQSNIRRTH